MSSGATPCVPCCTTTQNVQVPGVAGDDGADGADGSNGVSAYTLTTADFTVPAVGANVTVSVGNSSWMVVGQPIFVQGPANFVVSSKPSSTSVILTFQGFEDDVAPASTISSGAGVSPGGSQASAVTASRLSAYASGGSYDLDATPQILDFTTTDPELTINEAGTWMILARARVDYFFATYAADDNDFHLKLRRTNNTAADLSNGQANFKMRDVTTAYFTAGVVNLPPVFYTTTNVDDNIELWGWLDTLPDNDPLGVIRVYEAEIVAIKISD